MRDQNETVLVERLRDRDEHALSEVASLYGHKIFQLTFRSLRNHEDAEEVVQDVLHKVFRKIDAFRGDSALSSWIYRITFNTAMSRLRRTIYRDPVILRDLKGLTTEAASLLLRVKDQTLKSRLHRGRTLLRERLADFGGGLSMHPGSTNATFA
jgi:DNA-directed RNA polymerase specialized sigma24 family protein